MRKFGSSAAAAVMITVGLGLAGFGAAGTLPAYHGCLGHPPWTHSHSLHR